MMLFTYILLTSVRQPRKLLYECVEKNLYVYHRDPIQYITYMLLTSVREPREILCEVVEINS